MIPIQRRFNVAAKSVVRCRRDWLGEYVTLDWYPEFDKPLGAPKGDAIHDGWKYERNFTHASVFVDLETKTARIDWKP